jgi:hypothetical protein
MKLTPRFRTRTMMAIIALIALGISATFELKNHAERDQLLRRQAVGFRLAAIHHKRAVECQFAEEKHQPYQPTERAKLLAIDRAQFPIPPGGFRSWEHELLTHQFWGYRFYDVAESLDKNLEAVEARLLLPSAPRR